MESTHHDVVSIKHRPNSCDVCHVATLLFLIVMVIAISTPVLLSASKGGLPWIENKLMEESN